MDPFTIAAAISALMAAYGTYQKYQAAKSVRTTQDNYMNAEMARQRGFDEQRSAAMAAATPKFDPATQQQQQQSIAQKMQAQLTPQGSANDGSYVAQNPGAPQEIADKKQAVMDDASRKGVDYARRLGDMSAYKLLNFGNATTLNRLGENVGLINSNALRSADIIPLEMQQSQRAGAGHETRADIANGIGSIASLYAIGASRTPPPSSDMGGGTGITAPADNGYSSEFPGPNGINQRKPSGQGLRVAGVPRLVF